MLSESLGHLLGLAGFQLDLPPRSHLSQKAHLPQPCWPRPKVFLTASTEDFFEHLRLEKDVILLLVSQRVLVGWVLALKRAQVDWVNLGVNHPKAVRRRRQGEQTDQQAGTTRQ
jgi:hypothetical protein